MKFFKKLRERYEADIAAIQSSKEILDEVVRTDPEVDQRHEVALVRLAESAEQAYRLQAADRRNHYSESLTNAFRGKPA